MCVIKRHPLGTMNCLEDASKISILFLIQEESYPVKSCEHKISYRMKKNENTEYTVYLYRQMCSDVRIEEV